MVTCLFNLKDELKYTAYSTKARELVEQYGGRFSIASHGKFTITAMEGNAPDIVNIAVFPSKEKYLNFYNSQEYQKILQERLDICTSQITMLEKEKL
jgi:uncharacterized protein (DUF1330 family)